MSGVLQRLAVQARSPNPTRVRPATSVHAQAPTAPSASSDTPVLDTHRIEPNHQSRTKPEGHLVDAPWTNAFPEASSRHTGTSARSETSSTQRIKDATAEPAESPHPVRVTAEGKRESTAPSPLLEDVEIASQSTSNAVPAPSPMQFPVRLALSTSSAESREVHVHIGRIEVTAVHEPVPSRKKTAPPRQTRLLSDYLSRRRTS